MSTDEDTFDIDIYGDDHAALEPKPNDSTQVNGHDSAGYVQHEANESAAASEQTLGAEAAAEDEIDFDIKDEPTEEQESRPPSTNTARSQSAPQTQGTKRKVEDVEGAEQDQQTEQPSYEEQVDDRPVDQGATTALKLAELHWWTNEEDLRQFCAEADAESELTELAFGEHKINGKSKGEAYLEFSSLQAATATKHVIVRAAQVKEESGVKKTPFTVYFTAGGNPFRTAQGSTGKKEFQQSTGRGGAYNSFNNNRGGFVGRGNFNNNAARGGFNANNNNNNMMQNRATPPQQGGWGMNGMGGFGANPMMAAGYGNMASMGGFGNMNRGGMMNGMNMMGRGGFPNMNMGMGMGMNMMGGGGRGGGMMGGRGGGGWAGAGGFQGGGGGFNGGGGFGMQGQGGGSPQQGGVNKRMKMGE
nr:hypothetical protein CFP56_20676 [Quercus suber]